MSEGMEYYPSFELTGREAVSNRAYIDKIYIEAERFLRRPIHIHYTDHSIGHSLRIERHISDLLSSFEVHLAEPEKVVLLGAILLHDVGMQITPFEIAPDQESMLTIEQLNEIRARHHELSYEYIKQSLTGDNPDNLQSVIRSGGDYIGYIAMVSRYHRKINLLNDELNDTKLHQDDFRPRLLAALLRLGDCLDMESDRVDVDKLSTSSIPIYSQFLWYCHHYVKDITVTRKESVVTFWFPEKYHTNSKCQIAIDSFVTKGLVKQIEEVDPILSEYGIYLHSSIKQDIKNKQLINNMPLDLEIYVENDDYILDPHKETDIPGAPDFLTFSVEIEKALSAASGKLYNLPDRDPDFTGREDYLHAIQNYFAGGTANHTLTIVGTGGFGKSSVAVEYAYRNVDSYDYIWFINADSRSGIEDSLRIFAFQSGLEWALIEKDMSLVLGYVQKWQRANHRYLFIFDNAEGPGDISDYLPEGLLNGDFIITTRNKHVVYGEEIKLLVFSDEDAVEYLLNNKHARLVNTDEAQELARQLGNLPLALKHAVAFMEKSRASCSQYLEELENNGLKLLDKGVSRGDETDSLISATWQASMEQIQSESAQWLFNLCAYCASDDIPLSLFIKGSSKLPTTALRYNMQRLNELNLYDLIQDLEHYSLVSITRDISGEVYMSIHRLIQEVVKQKHKDNGNNSWLKICLDVALEVLPRDLSKLEARAEFTLYLPHVLAIADEAYLDLLSGNRKRVVQIADLYGWAGKGLLYLNKYPESLSCYHQVLTILVETLGNRHLDTANTYNNLTAVYYGQGDYTKALEYSEKALIICEQVLGVKHPVAAVTYFNLARILRAQGGYAKALEWYEKALVINKVEMGEKHPDTAAVYNNMAIVYRDQGDYAKALRYFRLALAIYEDAPGEGNRDTAAIYNNVATIHYAQGDYAKALDNFGRALTVAEQVLGEGHPDTATTYNNMAAVYLSQGDYAKSLEWYGKALVVYTDVLGEEHPDTATTYNNMAMVYRLQGNYAKALEFSMQALVICEQVLGVQHPDTVNVYDNIARVFRAQGDYSKALEWCGKALAIDEVVLGLQHPYTVSIYMNTKDCYRETNPAIPFEQWWEEYKVDFEPNDESQSSSDKQY